MIINSLVELGAVSENVSSRVLVKIRVRNESRETEIQSDSEVGIEQEQSY